MSEDYDELGMIKPSTPWPRNVPTLIRELQVLIREVRYNGMRVRFGGAGYTVNAGYYDYHLKAIYGDANVVTVADVDDRTDEEKALAKAICASISWNESMVINAPGDVY